MKFVAVTGGLGNQLFIYAFCLELRKRGYKSVLFKPYSERSKYYGHQGYELKKLFHIDANDGIVSAFCSLLLTLYTWMIKVFPVRIRVYLYKLVGIYVVAVPENFIYYREVFSSKHHHELFRGTWQSEQFFSTVQAEIRASLQFDISLLSAKTCELVQQIKTINSVSIHIRRGDYLSNQYANGFAGVCTPEYYTRSVEYMRHKVTEVQFYVFTDDPEWVNSYFQLENAIYVQHNTGADSWQDMYLMSRCKHNIIANSSFSWWGAWLNRNPEKIVIAPQKWWRLFEKDDVVPLNWIRI